MSSEVSVSTDLIRHETNSSLNVSDRVVSRLMTFAICALPVLTFTTPGRPSPSSLAFLDGLALVKLCVLLIVFCCGFPIMLLRLRLPDDRRTLMPLALYYLYTCWAVFSVFWTPLPAVTVGQSGGLASLLVLTSLVGLTCHNRGSLEHILRTLCRMLLIFSLFVWAVDFLAPNYSGLDRRILAQGSDGVVHPTAAGANASLGLLLATLCYFMSRYAWAGRMLFLSVLIHLPVLYLASSRMALGMAVLTIPVIVFQRIDNGKRAQALLAAAVLAIVFVIADPGFQSLFDSDSASVKYLTRGQTTGQLKGVSGRAEMWDAVWKECKKSPLIGHGYFVTSATGSLYVWFSFANHTAHNIYLQVLVGTGVIGLGLFLAAIVSLCIRFQRLRSGDQDARMVYQMLAYVFIWYLGWSLLCVSFMGPVRSESVVFFTFVGIGLGQLSRLRKAETGSAEMGTGTEDGEPATGHLGQTDGNRDDSSAT